MYLGDHRWSVSPLNRYLVTDGVYWRQTAALQTADCLWGLCLLRSPSAASLRGKTRPQPATPNPLFLKLTNHVAPRAASRTRSPRSTSISMETHTDEVWVVIPDRTDRREEGSRAGVAMVIWRQRDTPASSCCHRDTECMSSNAQQDRKGGGFSERAQICKRRSLAG